MWMVLCNQQIATPARVSVGRVLPTVSCACFSLAMCARVESNFSPSIADGIEMIKVYRKLRYRYDVENYGIEMSKYFIGKIYYNTIEKTIQGSSYTRARFPSVVSYRPSSSVRFDCARCARWKATSTPPTDRRECLTHYKSSLCSAVGVPLFGPKRFFF